MADSLIDDRDPAELFEVLSKLGEGSYGSVYKALDKRDGKLVAIKVLEVEDDDTSELQKEINILRECDCEWIVQYKGSYRKDGAMWIVMEFLGAGSLCDLIAITERTLTEEQIAVIMKQCLQGLEYLETKKIVHRDIKSGNILINHHGDCKLADFGVSAELATTLSKRKTVIGTPYWMAPEVLQSAEYNGKADIWSLAVTAIELAVGEPPHSNIHPMRAIFLIPTSDPPTLPDPSQWSADFNDFLRVCLVKNPDKRPSATQLLRSHPFILKAKSKAIIAQLVDECMQEIDEYRAQEAAEAAAAAEAGGQPGDSGTMQQVAPSGSSNGTGTMVHTSASGTMVQSGTMVHNPSARFDQGTMLFNGGAGHSDYEEGAGDSGTMVMHSTTLAKPPGAGALDGGAGGARAKYEEPSYMRHMREASNKFKRDGAAASAGSGSGSSTMLVHQLSSLSLSSPDLATLYRTGRKLDAAQLEAEQNSGADLQAALANLDAAMVAERRQLEAAYEEAKKTVMDAINKKSKK